MLEPQSTPPVIHLKPNVLAQLFAAARSEPRAPQRDPFSRRNKDLNDLGGYSYDGLEGITKETEWFAKYIIIFDLIR